MQRQPYSRYDPCLKNLVAESGDISQFLRYGIPKSTLRERQGNGYQEFFTIPDLCQSSSELIKENRSLKSQFSAVKAEHDLFTTTIKIFGYQIQSKRRPSSLQPSKKHLTASRFKHVLSQSD